MVRCTELIAVRFTRSEHGLIEGIAEIHGITPSDLLRELLGLEREDEVPHRPSRSAEPTKNRAWNARERSPDPVSIYERTTEREGFEPSNEVAPVTRFPVAPVQPLRHLSSALRLRWRASVPAGRPGVRQR
jgi:hypothetical protein